MNNDELAELNKWAAEKLDIILYGNNGFIQYAPDELGIMGVSVWNLKDARCREICIDYFVDKLDGRKFVSKFHEQYVLGLIEKKADMELACMNAIRLSEA